MGSEAKDSEREWALIIKRNHQMLFLVLVSIVVVFAWQGSRGLYESTEGRYSLCAREMADSGHWLEPTLLGQPHWTKPPLAYWLLAAGIKACGHTTWGVRIPIAVAFVITVLALSALGEALWDQRTGLLAGLLYATSPYPVMVANSVNTDTFICMWQVLAALCFWRAQRTEPERDRRAWITLFWLVLALGFLTKGPPVFMVAIPIVIWHACQPRSRRAGLWQPLGLVLFFLVATSWYLYEAWRHPGLLDYFLGAELRDRVLTDRFHRSPEWYVPFTLYVPLLLFGGGVWSYFGYRLIRGRRLFTLAAWRQIVARKGSGFYLATWVLIPLVIFSMSKSRLPTYVLPLFPAVALAIARWLRPSWEGQHMPTFVTRCVVSSAVVLIAAKATNAYAVHSIKDMGAVYEQCQPYDAPGRCRIFLYRMTRGFGLDFYADSPVTRLSTADRDNDADETIEGLLQSIESGAMRKRCVIIARKHKHDELVAMLRKAGISWTRKWDDNSWGFVLIEAETPQQTP